MADAGTALKLLGFGIQSITSVLGAKEAIKQSKYYQDILRYQANYEAALNKINEDRLRRDIRKVIGAQRSETAASGFQADTGTPLELQIDTEVQGDLDIALMRSSGSINQLRLQNQGQLARAEGYGIAAGLLTNASYAGLNALIDAGSRSGWFAQSKKTITVPKVTERQKRLGV